jgi:hypothetical protein
VHRAPWQPAPVFSLDAQSAQEVGFQPDPQDAEQVRRVFGADRAWTGEITTPDGLLLRVHTVEWDQVPRTRAYKVRNHNPEDCNTGRGYRLRRTGASRTWAAPDGEHVFATTHFDAPDGRPVVIFGLGWLEGVQGFRPDEGQRALRLRLVARPPRGAARVLQAGIVGTPDADTAWRAMEELVFPHLEWVLPEEPEEQPESPHPTPPRKNS